MSKASERERNARRRQTEEYREYQRKYQRERYHRVKDQVKEYRETPERKEYMATYVKTNRAKLRHAAKLRTYGLKQEQLTALLEHQNHECPICLRLLAYPVTPSIDHSHQTGVVRGVLCRKCNAALGLLEENTDNLERAIEYLSCHRRGEINNVLFGATSTTSSRQ